MHMRITPCAYLWELGPFQHWTYVLFSPSVFLLEWLVLAIFEGINGKTFEVVFPLYFVVVNCFGKENYTHAHTRNWVVFYLLLQRWFFWRHIFCLYLPLASSLGMVLTELCYLVYDTSQLLLISYSTLCAVFTSLTWVKKCLNSSVIYMNKYNDTLSTKIYRISTATADTSAFHNNAPL